MKKICIITPMFMPVPAVLGGGIENLITALLNQNELNDKFKFTVYTTPHPNIKNNYKNSNIKQIELNFFVKIIKKIINKIFNILKIEKYYDFNSILYKKIAKRIKKEQYDYLLVENNMQLYKTIYKHNKDKKIIFHLHNDLNLIDKTEEDYKFINNTAYKILVISNYLKERLNKVEKTEKIEVFSNAIDANKYLNHKANQEKLAELKVKYNINDNDKIIGYVGRIDPEKGLLELIKAFNLLDKKNVKLLLVCDNYMNIKYIKGHTKKLYKETEKNSNIVITGRIEYEQIIDYYDLIDILVIPTICQEAFGLVALEGKALKKRIIYTDSGAMPEILSDKIYKKIPLNKDIVNNLYKAMNEELSKDIKINKKTNIQGFEEYYENFSKVIK
ncbi:MAG: glycosyltransferase family 4 protein [Firmicutes bacterium]|nr:glycosyltransferase family 4 protein [Bacillota bacterium]